MASIVVAGDTSGTVTLSAPATAGTTTLTLPTTTGTVLASNSASTINSGTSSSMTLQTNGTTAMTIDTSQNVGIGTTSPSSFGKFAVYGAGTNVIGSFDGNSTYTFIDFYSSGANRVQIGNAGGTSGAMIMRTGDAERMRIDSSGKIIIGSTTSSSGTRLCTVSSTSGVDTNTSAITSTSGTRYHWTFQDGSSSTERGSITTNGSATAYNTSSDYRLKENIVPMTGALDTISKLKPVTYTWKSDNSNGQGFIAHELQEVVPDCVTGEKDAVDEEGNPIYQGVDTSFLVATLTAAIQEQQAIIETLKADIEDLKAKVK